MRTGRPAPHPLARAPADAIPWHARTADDVTAALATGPDGLDAPEAARRLATYGPNRLPRSPRPGALARLAAQVHNVLIYVLLASAALAAAIGDTLDALVILAVVVLNAAIGFVQEGRAENALEAIQTMIDPRASVVRDGRRVTVAAEAIVPGDVVILEAGDRVPADLRLRRTRNLRLEEAVLTGESVAVDKSPAPVAAEAPLGDRASMAFSGTFVAAGQGVGVVVATGAASELGRISALLGAVKPLKTPLVRKIDRFARHLTIAILAVAALVFLYAYRSGAYPLGDAFMAVVGLIVAAIPEGLPAVMTIALAIGVERMARRNAIIRRLPAVETLGSVTVICSDKTGTLSRNEMTASSVVTAEARFEVSGAGYAPHGAFRAGGRDVDAPSDAVLAEATRAALLCNDASLRQQGADWVVDGDSMEGALISLAVKAGHDADLVRRQLPRTDEIPFDAEHRFMATLHHSHDGVAFAVIKGAPEAVLARCARQRTATGGADLDVARWHAAVEALAASGQRVIAIAVKPLPPRERVLTFADVAAGATMLGLIGLLDPPREDAIAAVAECLSAGVRVVMITGDHAGTAAAVARRLGLAAASRVVTGDDLDDADAAGLGAIVAEVDVFARTSPEHKLRIVEALQAGGAVVAMTGDGVNDAPALKRADIGVAMGAKGTEAAKEAAEMVLADDNFASIVAAVSEGRTVYDNIKKVIAWTLPTNGGEALAIITAIVFGLTLPVTPTQILWINMVTAVALGLTLAFEPAEPGTMRRPPRPPAAPLLSRHLAWRVVFVSVLFVVGAFGIFYWALERAHSLETARTLVVNALVVMEIFYLFSVRYAHGRALTWRGLLGTPAVLIGVAVTVLAQIAFTYAPPLQLVFDSRPVPLLEGAVVVALGVALLFVVEAEKQALRLWARRPRRQGARSA